MCAAPLKSVVDAQGIAALSTVNFIQQVGFTNKNEAINVNFTYQSLNGTTGRQQTNILSVPILTILPIPFIRVRFSCVCLSSPGALCELALYPPPALQIDRFTLDFNADISSITTSSQSNFNQNWGANVNWGYWWSGYDS